MHYPHLVGQVGGGDGGATLLNQLLLTAESLLLMDHPAAYLPLDDGSDYIQPPRLVGNDKLPGRERGWGRGSASHVDLLSTLAASDN